MQDYASRLLFAINGYDQNDPDSINHLRDLVCWISDNESLKQDKVIAELLYLASQKMRVFGYNILNGYTEEPRRITDALNDVSNQAITNLYRSKVNPHNVLDKSQQEVVDLFQSLDIRRLLVSAPTSYGKTFLMREIVFLNRKRYHNILLVFPTVALLLENARAMANFVKDKNLGYEIVKTVDGACESDGDKIFVYTPERALQLIASFPEIKLDFFFFDEIYKIDEDYCYDELDDKSDFDSEASLQKTCGDSDFLCENRGKTFRIALYLLAKSVDEYYLAGPNLNKSQFGLGMKRFIKLNHITVKEILFEPTLRIAVDVCGTKVKEQLPQFVPAVKKNEIVRIESKVNDKIKDVVTYIEDKHYGKTLLYCTTPAKAIEYSSRLAQNIGSREIVEKYPKEFLDFIAHIKREYDVNGSVDEWSLIKVLENGFGMHHGKLPKYIQQEILEQFNNNTFNVLFCTSTIVEGVNTDAQNMIILNSSKGKQKLTPFDIKNIKGRAGRYYHCFIGRVFYMNKELLEIEKSGDISLDFVTYSSKKPSIIDIDNAEIEDLTIENAVYKKMRDEDTREYCLPPQLFIQNRTVSKENQEKLLQCFLKHNEYSKLKQLLIHPIIVEDFLRYRWITKILELFLAAGLINEWTKNKYSAVANSYYENGFKGILDFEVRKCKKGRKPIDNAYAEAFKSLRDILEYKIPKILSLFESIAVFVAKYHGDYLDNFSLSSVRRFYETGVKSLFGEALIEYGFPTDAIRRIEEKNVALLNLSVSESKDYCKRHYNKIALLLDEYERKLFIKAINSF